MTRKELIDEIIRLEWGMFTTAHNNGGRASCQDDWPTFEIMRRSQHEIWAMDTLDSYRADLSEALGRGENLVAFKYGYMMRITFPEEYEAIKAMLPAVTPEKRAIVDEIAAIHADWALEKAEKYPLVSGMGRPRTSQEGGRWAAIDNYLYSELLTYSEPTLILCLRDTRAARDRGENLSVKIVENTARLYGYTSLDALEASMRGTRMD
ncbi:MAG: DUF4125 family protein [Clostridiales bacterium]|nr:DUF4125 family protein [Clostridiales bacterium]